MSCGKLHEQGEPFHLHAPGEEHPGEYPEPDGTDDAELDVPAPRGPGWVERTFAQIGTAASGAWRQHGYLVKPFAVIPAMEASEFLISHAFTDPASALVAAGVLTLAGEGVTEAVNWRGQAVRPVRRKTRFAVAAGGAMAVIGGAGVFDAWTVLATLVVGAVAGGRIVHEEHKAHKSRPAPAREVAPAPEPEAITAGPDPRLLEFTGAFCGPGCPLAGTAVLFREIANGFLFELDFTGTQHAPDDVAKIVTSVAKLFNVVKDAISVEYVPEPGKHSENYCQVVIRKVPLTGTGERAASQVKRWDGKPTWDPATGCADLGWFTDGAVAHYRFHVPRSGTQMGLLTGVMGSGKTGTINVLGAEAGQAVLCRACGPARSCPKCSPERVMAVWMGDAQGQGLSVWRGRADLSAFGPEGCMELLEFADQVAQARAAERQQMIWYDQDPVTGQRRQNTGKGWYDVEIGQPMIFLVLDEFPELLGPSADPVMRAEAKRLIIRAFTTWRKLGIHLLPAAASADTTLIGDRLIRDLIKYFNVIAHRADEFNNTMTGINGDPSKLPKDLPGAGFISGYDGRDSEFATKFAPETHQPGDPIDIRRLAGEISKVPLLYDAPVRRLMAEGQWGIPHQHVFTQWYGRQKAEAASGIFPDAPAAPPAPAPAAAPAVPPAPAPEAGMPAAQDTERVLQFLRDNPGAHSIGAVTNGIFRATGTKMSVATVLSVAPALHASQQAVYGADKKLQAA